MNFTELCAEVYKLTGRPDKVAETESAVKSATLFCHTKDYFFKDIIELGLNFGAPAYLQQLDYRNVVPRYRAFKWLRKYDYLNSTPGKVITLVDTDSIFDRYGSTKPDTCYVAGAYININSSTQEQYYTFGCYSYPDINTATYSSWIALDNPYAIVYKAVAAVMVTIGKDEEASSFLKLALAELDLVVMSNIQAEGY